MSKLVVIDLGNSIVKVKCGSKFFNFQSKLKKIDQSVREGTESITLNNECWLISQGDYVHEMQKSSKFGLEHLILYAITNVTDKRDVNLILHLPINQASHKEEMKARFSNKTFNFQINSNSLNLKDAKCCIKINFVGVIEESVASYYSIIDHVHPFTTIVDIGSKNINYASYTDLGVLDVNKSGTLDYGLHDMYNKLITYFIRTGNINYSISDIDARVRNNKIEIPEATSLDFIREIKNSFLANKFVDYRDYDFKFVGGGSKVLKEHLLKTFKNSECLENELYRNVIGSSTIGEAQGLDK